MPETQRMSSFSADDAVEAAKSAAETAKKMASDNLAGAANLADKIKKGEISTKDVAKNLGEMGSNLSGSADKVSENTKNFILDFFEKKIAAVPKFFATYIRMVDLKVDVPWPSQQLNSAGKAADKGLESVLTKIPVIFGPEHKSRFFSDLLGGDSDDADAKLTLHIFPGPTIATFIDSLDIDAPVTLTFVLICMTIHWLNSWGVLGDFQQKYFSCHPWQFANYHIGTGIQFFNVLPASLPLIGGSHTAPYGYFMNFDFFSLFLLSYWRLIGHIFGHGGWDHLSGNVMNMLLVGPACEKAFGVWNLIKIILYVAIFSGLAHQFFGHPQAVQLGASGVVFMLIILNSLISLKTGKVPITFVLQCAFWLWKEVIDQLFSDHAQSGVSNIAHLSGAICGTWFGYRLHGEKVRERTKKVAGVWMGRIAGKKNK